MNEVSNCLVQGFSTPALEVHFPAELGQPLSNTSKQVKQGSARKLDLSEDPFQRRKASMHIQTQVIFTFCLLRCLHLINF